MSRRPGETRAEPFFLKEADGQRFCLYHRPVGTCRGAVLYVHPFAEEMNRSRRMAALQASELAALGYGVLQIDLFGCGDSSGDFGEARWELWKQDLASAAAWLAQRLDQPVTLWGLRLGALLALDYARGATHPVAAVLLWQPVLSGPAFLTQFLRLRVASAMLNNTSERGGTSALRAALQAGEVLEIGGYDLAPAMAGAIDALESVEAMPPSAPVHWVEAVGSSDGALSPARTRVARAWRMQGVALNIHLVHGPAFWSTPEITVSPAWLDTTSSIFMENKHGI
jgi:exosortase A-associated hydrolase 2